MFEKRLRGYRAIGYVRDERVAIQSRVKDEFVLEYDEEELRSFEGKE
jgi:hypothetical protein